MSTKPTSAATTGLARFIPALGWLRSYQPAWLRGALAAFRFTDFNNVDLAAAKSLNVTVTRVMVCLPYTVGKFSSDRSIRDYCAQVWNIQPASVRSGSK